MTVKINYICFRTFSVCAEIFMRRLLSFAAAVLSLGLAATIAGCSGCSSCSSCSSSYKNTALTNSNWYAGTSYKGIQPSFITGEKEEYTPETVSYSVTFDSSSASNSYYSVDYRNGSYKTNFYGGYYDWSADSIPEAYRQDTNELVYYYETELEISVQFTYGDENSGNRESTEWFSDSIITKAVFRSAGDNLAPVYSCQKIVSHTPANLQAGSLEETYETVEAEYECFYNYGCSQATVLSTLNGEDSEKTYYDLDETANSLFDNAYLYIAVRSMKLSSSLSQTINIFSAVSGGVSAYTLSGSDEALSADEQTKVSEELEKRQLYTQSGDSTLATVAVDIAYSGGNLSGTTQTVWFAAIEDSDNNTARATMLKISTPLSYSLGTLVYTLDEIESTLWNG